MPGTDIRYGRNEIGLWILITPIFPIFFGAIHAGIALNTNAFISAGAAIASIIAWILSARFLNTVPVDVSPSPGGLSIHALRRWHPYRELDLHAGWPMVRAVLFGQNLNSPKAWLFIRLREPNIVFTLTGETERIRALEEALLSFLPKQDPEAADQLSDTVSGRGFWKGPATLILVCLGAAWTYVTGEGVLTFLGWMKSDKPFPWDLWIALTLFCLGWFSACRAARK